MFAGKARLAAWLKALAAGIALVCLWWFQRFPEALEFHRDSILSGQLWRIWTGHWVHANGVHLLLNGAVGLLLYWAFFRFLQTSELIVTGLVFSFLISGLFLLFMPELDWYNGLSGLLHAWIMYGSIRKIYDREPVYWLGVGIVVVKVVLEFCDSSIGFGGNLHGVHVLHEAHLIGALVGALAAISQWRKWLLGQQEKRGQTVSHI